MLSIDQLTLSFRTRAGQVQALDQVSLQLHKGETLGLVGESGSGKSVLSFAIMGISDPAAELSQGSITMAGMDLLAMSAKQLNDLRGREMAMIFQNPRAALNPIRKVGQQLEDVLARHTATRRQDLASKAIALLREVRISDPEKRYHAYPFEMSGGQCQRVMIAIALAANPMLLIADEPTTGLDVTTQDAIMALIREAKARREMACLLITHDLALAAENCDRIAVMHAGHIVEVAEVAQLFQAPRHPYTQALLKSLPGRASNIADLQSIQGSLPDLRRNDLPPCRYAERCAHHHQDCDQASYALKPIGQSRHWVACVQAHRLPQPA